ncbi:hypothetical protein ACFL49_02820 [Candidatus Omnitrophota bacterium]
MISQYLRSKKGQNTAEYAILISLVIAGIIAMQTYAQRALQARVRDGSIYMTEQTGDIGSTQQYEPYYKDDNFNNTTNDRTQKDLAGETTSLDTDNVGTRTGTAVSQYNQADGGTGM